MIPILQPNMIEAVARALGDTNTGLTGTEIDNLMTVCGIVDEYGAGTKWRRLNHNFWNQQAKDKKSDKIEIFIRQAMSPSRYLSNPDKFEAMKENLNKALSFIGLYVDDSGEICPAGKTARTISEAEQRATDLHKDLQRRNIHPRVLHYCRAELLADDYFHAAHEAVKGVFDRLREMSGVHADGHKLVDALLVKGKHASPNIIINGYQTDSEQSEQTGFANMLKGIYGMFRNPTAHEVRVKWVMKQEDAEDLLSMVSLIHRRLDGAHKVR